MEGSPVISWSDLSSSKRDLLLAVGVVNRDDDRRASGIVVIRELRERFGYDGRNETYYVALTDLSRRGLVRKQADEDDGDSRQKHYELTPAGLEMLDQHRADVDDSVRVLA